MSSRPLWAPDRDQSSQTNLARFAAGVGIDIGADGGYERLHRWSVEDLGGFWSAVWDFCGVVASERGSAPIVGAEHMADARFFDGARLNFAENLLAGDDDQTAMVFADESGAHAEMSRGELRGAGVPAGRGHAGPGGGRRRPGGVLDAQRARGLCGDAGRRLGGGGVLVHLSRLRRCRGARPLWPDRARAVVRGWTATTTAASGSTAGSGWSRSGPGCPPWRSPWC